MRGGGRGCSGWIAQLARGWLVAMLGLTVWAPAAGAQLSLQLWGRPVAAIPVGDFAGRERGIDAGRSVGVDVGGAVGAGQLRIYGEYQQVDFDCGECAEAALRDRVLDRGWGAGVIVPVLPEPGRFDPWVRLGVIGHHLRFRSDDEAAYSDGALGWATGAGASIRPFDFLRIEPAILLRSYETRVRFSIDVPDRGIAVTYLALGLGISLALP